MFDTWLNVLLDILQKLLNNMPKQIFQSLNKNGERSSYQIAFETFYINLINEYFAWS